MLCGLDCRPKAQHTLPRAFLPALLGRSAFVKWWHRFSNLCMGRLESLYCYL